MQLASAWSVAASPVGRNGVAVNRASRSRLAASAAARWSSGGSPRSAASSSSARVVASFDAAADSGLPPAGRGENNSTAAVPATDAIHQPIRRSGIMPTVPTDAAGRT